VNPTTVGRETPPEGYDQKWLSNGDRKVAELAAWKGCATLGADIPVGGFRGHSGPLGPDLTHFSHTPPEILYLLCDCIGTGILLLLSAVSVCLISWGIDCESVEV
jgi:hypothetical protein